MFELKRKEAVLITNKPNIFYLSKVNAESGLFLFFIKNKKFICTDARFIKGASKLAKGFIPVETNKKDKSWFVGLLKKNNIKTIYFEPSIPYYKLYKFKKLCRSIARLKPIKIDLQKIRSIKYNDEIKKIAKSADIASNIMDYIKKMIINKKHITEFDLVLEILKQSALRRCVELSFSPIVAFGKNTGIPHHIPSRFKKLNKGDMVLIDLGVKYQNYCSDITRTFFTSSPTQRQEQIYNKVRRALDLSVKKVKHKAKAAHIVERVHNFFKKDSVHFTHGLGHGVGLEIHEQPNLKLESDCVLRTNQVLTIEPGLYFSWGGVRIEDMIIVQKNKCKIITKSPKKLEILSI